MQAHKRVFMVAWFTASCLWLMGCQPTEPAAQPEVLFQQPANFPKPVYALDQNQPTEAGFRLGRALFYDGLLSRDGSIACVECHNQAYAFTHHQHDVSHGIDNRVGTRNSLPLQNLAWQSSFFWDGGVHDLDLVPIAPIENPVEMDEQSTNVIAKLRKSPKYPPLFKAAFGTDDINGPRFLQALSQFMLTLVSANSRYDKWVRKEPGGTLTDDELAGLTVFRAKCSGCHAGELFTDNSFRNNGLFIQGSQDLGRAHVTERAQDRYRFKVPSLRNVEKTLPYMHDGRFYSLEAVMNHYADNVQPTENLDPLLQPAGQAKPGIALTTNEKRQLIAFLKTLTDDQFLRDSRFVEP
ncbi:cytochrome c peroxidase [Fibrella aestuarina BUZ 2]|uniref:Cytochrome c peroxidase n=1 Tax=Fibrella aestuarina BUZ 2 TaxID=1166018 RepID=I0K790_9BACT|nr:cytochrome c peroxidase [Fibrella aestuarina]CCG99993.1 cytochrome c peroxidase [Fibrella aestuarina BUZ 2]